MPSVLRLEVREFAGRTRWQWVLTNMAGAFIADQEVRIDERDWQFEAARDLHGYISWHASPDERCAEDEARIVHETGAWLGEHVLGPAITDALAQARKHGHVTVQVIIPPGSEALALLPLETAHADGKPLAQHDITLVMQTGTAEPGTGPAGQRERLRVLGLFSLPEGGTPLNLRRERQELVKLIGGIAARGRAAEIRVLQYGVTQDRLRDVLEEAEGWDIIHVSGHGTPGSLVLETADGRPDSINANDLGNLLDTAREHVRLVTLSACWSAGLSAAEQRRLLRLPVPEEQTRHPERSAGDSPAPPPPGALATELANRLGCAVLAMRYPVDDEFAIGLSGKLYELLAAKGQALSRAVAMTLKQLSGNGTGGRAFPALSVAAPALFGEPATQLCLRAPQRSAPVSYATETLKMAGFPPQPERFVGRTAVMACASAALAEDSGTPGVLLHGMPGGGKTACALELAYTHEDSFDRLVWYKAPDEGMAIDGSLTDFALTLERDLPDFRMIHVLADDAKLTAFLPELAELLERSRVLLVIDNAESLLTDGGQWRDDRWGQVVSALADHRGLGRVILTSRRVPATMPAREDGPQEPGQIAREPVDALSADEALLLARELPHLDALIRGGLPGLDPGTARRLALGVLNTAQGHPKLLELADGQAARPGQLDTLIQAGDRAWRDQGGLPDGFFDQGTTSAASPADYLHVLAAWTNTVTGTLSPGERDLFWFLCCLEEPDRERPVVCTVWPRLWQRLGRDGNPPDLDQALTAIAARGLTALQEATSDEDELYAIHPGVAAAGRNHAGNNFQGSVDAKAAAYWNAIYWHARGEIVGDTVDTRMLVRAGLSAVPYLTRQQQWEDAALRLHNAFIRDPTRANAAAVLPAIQQITRHVPHQTIAFATVLRFLDPAAAETELRANINNAAARSDYQAAGAATAQLIDLCLDSGRLAEALDLAKQKADYTGQADLGPWTQLSDEIQRLQVLNAMGQARHVLDEVHRLRDHMDTLPADPRPGEVSPPWSVRELLLDTGRYAARELGKWQDALDLNAEQIASKRDRRAPAANIARARANDYGPLLQLGRTDDALALLLDCRQAFHDARDFQDLGKMLSALSRVEDQRGHSDAAVRFASDALRYTYLAGDVTSTAASYHNLGNYLRRHTRQPTPAVASHLTAALIYTLTGAVGADDSVHAATLDMREFGAAAESPADIADLCRRLGDIPGTDPAALIATLAPAPETAEQALQDLIAQARELAQEPPG